MSATHVHSVSGSGSMHPDIRRVRRFETRIAVCAGGGEICDGWVLGVVGAALPLAHRDLELTPVWAGLIGSASLIGLFFGGLIFGWVTDKVGRQKMYLIDLIVFLIGSLLQLVVQDAMQLLAVRLVMGAAVGADYAIAGALVAEFAPPKRRGRLLASLIVFWYIGYTLAAAFGFALTSWATDGSMWRWILASSAVPSLVVLLARLGTPESPSWLASKGRIAEAEAISERWLGRKLDRSGIDEEPVKTSHRLLFSRPYLRRTLFTSLFWLCQVTPFFAISTFSPQALSSLGAPSDGVGELLLNLFLLAGCLTGMTVIDRLGRRRLLIWPFVVTAGALLALGLWPHGPQWAIAMCFGVFALFHAGSSVLQAVYPSEVFPTQIRATGIGFAAAVSRIGAAVGTFLIPMGLDAWGVSAVMLLGCALSLVGALVSLAWAPETSGLELAQVSRRYAPSRTEQRHRPQGL
ncbi:MFS transporter [Streptomyces inhibens]|uniref:MFS transporter n=1 Tax=Streptomyces inhibens TaxID=2293571 RepID=UPI001EE6AD47|nr:MFS transporter [Streptomyces inhibens]UKY53523.1 MFS transporter [Streptomyces inhibens]